MVLQVVWMEMMGMMDRVAEEGQEPRKWADRYAGGGGLEVGRVYLDEPGLMTL